MTYEDHQDILAEMGCTGDACDGCSECEVNEMVAERHRLNSLVSSAAKRAATKMMRDAMGVSPKQARRILKEAMDTDYSVADFGAPSLAASLATNKPEATGKILIAAYQEVMQEDAQNEQGFDDENCHEAGHSTNEDFE